MSESVEDQAFLRYSHPENDPEELRKAYGLETLINLELVLHNAEDPLLPIITFDSLLINGLPLESKDVLPKDVINTPISLHKLCPIHIAVISGNKTGLLLLVQNGADANARDARLWTPLHHAALSGNQEIINLLLENGADGALKDDTERTYLDILRLENFQAKQREQLINLFYSDEIKPEYQLDAQGYSKLTKSEYIDENIITKKRMLKFWKEGQTTVYNPKLNQLFRDKFSDYLKLLPSHMLSPVLKNSSGESLPFSPGLGLFSRQVFEPQEVLGEYKGLYSVEYGENNQYLVSEGPDAYRYSNETSRINDGFPNVSLLRLPNINGLPYRRIFIALERIEPGQQIVWNYGPHQVKVEPYIELRPRELRHFLQMRDFHTKMNALTVDFKSAPDVYELFPLAEKIRYVLQTPPILFILLFEGIIKMPDLKDLVRIGDKTKLLPKQWTMLMATFLTVTEDCLTLRDRLNFISEKTASDLVKYLVGLPLKMSLLEVLAVMRGIITRFNDYFINSFNELRTLGPEICNQRMQNLWKEIHQQTESYLNIVKKSP